MKPTGIITSLLTLSGLLGAQNAAADIPAGLYDGLEGLSGVELKKAVKAAARKDFIPIRYGTESFGNCTWKVFLQSDTRSVGGTRCWWDMYSANNVAAPNYTSRGDMNIEHGVPNSWWGGNTDLDAYKDVFHLNPSDADANYHKQNYPLGLVASLQDADTWTNEGGYTTVGKPAPGSSGGAGFVFEPADEYKGDFARTYFYIFTAYDDIAWRSTGTNWMYDTMSELTLKPWAFKMLLDWAKNDPVSQKELDRNEAIFRNQGNRNPFIDHPELAEHIWGDLRYNPFHLDGSFEEAPERPKGHWVPVTSDADLNEDDRYILVSTSRHIGMSVYAPTYATPYYMLECHENPRFDAQSSPSAVSYVPEDVAVIRLKGAGSQWVMSVSDLNDVHRGYLCSSEQKQMYLTSGATDKGTAVTISPTSSQTSILFPGGAGYLKYNNYDSGRRFTTYPSGQEAVMMYRYVALSDGGSQGGGQGSDGGNTGGDKEKDLKEMTEDFSAATGLPMGSGSKPSSPTGYTSGTTGIRYTIMGCYVNNYEAPYYLLINGKNNPGAFISFTLEGECHEIRLHTTAGCSTNPASALNIYADGRLLGTYQVNTQNATVTVEIPEEDRTEGTEYKIESATGSYNQQLAGLTYVCAGGREGTTGIDDSREDQGLAPQIFTLDGARVDAAPDRLPKGIYVVKTGRTARKVIVK